MKRMNEDEDEIAFVDEVLIDLDARRLDVLRTKLIAHRKTLTPAPARRIIEEPGADY